MSGRSVGLILSSCAEWTEQMRRRTTRRRDSAAASGARDCGSNPGAGREYVEQLVTGSLTLESIKLDHNFWNLVTSRQTKIFIVVRCASIPRISYDHHSVTPSIRHTSQLTQPILLDIAVPT